MIAPSIILILGGARSGKSRAAQRLAEQLGGDPVYLATAEAFDDEMSARIAQHRADRGPAWRTVECPIELPAAVQLEAVTGNIVLIDCLTLWASNLILSDHDCDAATDTLLTALANARCPAILVSNEVGMGIVPDNALARRFRDVAGRMNQRMAERATSVRLMVAGLELTLK